MIVFILAIKVCWMPINCEWRTIGAFIDETECHRIGENYSQDSTVANYKCTIGMRKFIH